MRRSTERILTTHAGSLPRPDDLRDMLIAKDDGQPYDQARFTTRVQSAVAEVVQQQTAAGLDIINDGELSKRSFSTYARERLSGFEERPLSADERPSMISGRDMPEFAEYFASRGGFGGASANARQVFCTGPLRYVGHAAVQADIANFKAALISV
jgi:5-methyltetrahydropteroyltriglutamate--homocysteine methyltransferase